MKMTRYTKEFNNLGEGLSELFRIEPELETLGISGFCDDNSEKEILEAFVEAYLKNPAIMDNYNYPRTLQFSSNPRIGTFLETDYGFGYGWKTITNFNGDFVCYKVNVTFRCGGGSKRDIDTKLEENGWEAITFERGNKRKYHNNNTEEE